MSIPANIVEGKGQRSPRDFGRFLRYAIQSGAELEYHLIVARDLEVIARTDFSSLLGQLLETRKMLHGLLAHVDPQQPGDTTDA